MGGSFTSISFVFFSPHSLIHLFNNPILQLALPLLLTFLFFFCLLITVSGVFFCAILLASLLRFVFIPRLKIILEIIRIALIESLVERLLLSFLTFVFFCVVLFTLIFCFTLNFRFLSVINWYHTFLFSFSLVLLSLLCLMR